MNTIISMTPPTVLRALSDHLTDDLRDNEKEIAKCEALLNTLRSHHAFLSSMVEQCKASGIALKDNSRTPVIGTIGTKPEVMK